MTAPMFGRKGLASECGEMGVVAKRRAAFLAEERARADRAAETEVFPTAPRAAAAREPEPRQTREPVGPRSLRLTYVLWLALGLAGAHRLYLGRTITGAAQALFFTACVAAVALQYYQAFAGIGLCWVAMFADGLRLKRMHAEAVGPSSERPVDAG